jgi:hypothetical protein
MQELEMFWTKKIQRLCKHDFEEDYIDIRYCKICGYTK